MGHVEEVLQRYRAVSGIELDNLEAMWSYIENIAASEKEKKRL